MQVYGGLLMPARFVSRLSCIDSFPPIFFLNCPALLCFWFLGVTAFDDYMQAHHDQTLHDV